MSELLVDERNKQIGENIRKYRLFRGLTNEELCHEVCSVSQLSKIENGKTYAQRDFLKTFAERLDTTIARLESSDAMSEELREQLQYAKDMVAVGDFNRSITLTDAIIVKCLEFGYSDILLESYLHKTHALIQTRHFKFVISFVNSIIENVPDDSRYFTALLYYLGYAHQHNGEIYYAHDCFTQAYEKYESLDDHTDDLLELQIIYASAQCHGILKYNRLALRYAEKAEILSNKLSKHLYRLRSKYMKATILKRLGEYEKAEIELKESLHEAEMNDYLLDAAIISINLGEYYRDKQEYGLAYSKFDRANNLLELLNNHAMQIAVILEYAEMEFLTGNYHKSMLHIDKALSMMDNLNSDIYLEKARAYRLSARIYNLQGDFAAYKTAMLKALDIYSGNKYYVDAYDVSAELAKETDNQQDPCTLDFYRKALKYNEIIIMNELRR